MELNIQNDITYILSVIKLVRTNKNISQLKLAEGLNITQAAYGRIENGKTTLSVDLLLSISKILNISTLWLFEILITKPTVEKIESDLENPDPKRSVSTVISQNEDIIQYKAHIENFKKIYGVIHYNVNELIDKFYKYDKGEATINEMHKSIVNVSDLIDTLQAHVFFEPKQKS